MYGLLSWMQQDIDRYAAMQKSNVKAIETRKEILQKILRFTDIASQTTDYLMHQLSSEYKRGFVAGIERGRKENAPHKYLDKEGYRQYFINQQKQTLPNLY